MATASTWRLLSRDVFAGTAVFVVLGGVLASTPAAATAEQSIEEPQVADDAVAPMSVPQSARVNRPAIPIRQLVAGVRLDAGLAVFSALPALGHPASVAAKDRLGELGTSFERVQAVGGISHWGLEGGKAQDFHNECS